MVNLGPLDGDLTYVYRVRRRGGEHHFYTLIDYRSRRKSSFYKRTINFVKHLPLSKDYIITSVTFSYLYPKTLTYNLWDNFYNIDDKIYQIVREKLTVSSFKLNKQKYHM